MFKAIDHPYLIPYDGSFKVKDAITSIDEKQLDDNEYKKKLLISNNLFVDQKGGDVRCPGFCAGPISTDCLWRGGRPGMGCQHRNGSCRLQNILSHGHRR